MEITGQLIKEVWAKASPISGQDPEAFRLDIYGSWIRLKDYNNIDSIHGWTIYQVNPLGDEGFKDINNLLPMHTHENKIPLAGYNPPMDKMFQDSII